MNVPEAELTELRRRINATRWPERETVTDHSQGVPLATIQKLARYWASEYDWRKVESRLSAYPQFITEIDGLDIHFIHVRSKHDNALPLIVTHGWPGSVVEQLKIVDPLTDPTSHGGSASDAFHLVIPSMPGFGFSGKPTTTGWDAARIARAKFIQALFDGKIVSKDSLDLMKTIRDGDGLGMESFTFAGKTFYGHTGGGDNYGAWLAYQPEEKLAVAYTTNAKIYPVAKIVSGVIDIYYNKPFEIPALESIAVRPEVLDKYVGVYSSPDAPVKFTVTREGSTLFFQPPGGSAPGAPLEATAEDKFQIERAAVIEFDAAKNQMTIKRRGGERVVTKER